MSAALLITMCACGAKSNEKVPEDPSTAPESSREADQSASVLDAFDDVAVQPDAFDVSITIPSTFMAEMTQEECDQLAQENGYQSITLHDDGSATYVMTKAQHEKMMDDISASIDESLENLAGTEGYESIISIERNNDFTEYTVVTNQDTLGIGENLVTFGLFMFGGMYYTFYGAEVENICVKFVNESSGAVIQELNSKDLG